MTETNPISPTPAPVPAYVALRSDVKTRIDSCSDQVRQRVVEQLAEAEIQRRTILLATVLDKRKEAERAVYKIKPDLVSYNEAGAVTSTSYSKAKVDELKKAKELLAKIDKAIEKAINEADYEELAKVKDAKVDGGKEEKTEE